MKKDDKSKFLYLFIGITLILFLAGCVDTGVENIPSNISYLSQLKVVNLVPGSGTATITLNGAQIGTPNPGEEVPGAGQSFMDVPSGPNTLDINVNSTTISRTISTETQYKMRLYVVMDTMQVVHIDPVDSTIVIDSVINNYDVIKNLQRYTWQSKGSQNGSSLFPPNIIQVELFNGSPDAEVTGLRLYGGGGDISVDLDESVTYKGTSSYIEFETPSGDYSLDVITSDTTFTIGSSSYQTQGRYTAVIYDYTGVIKGGVFLDD